jgi:hypothetical protein
MFRKLVKSKAVDAFLIHILFKEKEYWIFYAETKYSAGNSVLGLLFIYHFSLS